jgi:hypothetical protein
MVYKTQTITLTWSSAAESISRVLADEKGESNADIARKILIKLGFKNANN